LKNKIILMLLPFLMGTSIAYAYPKEIILIRHAEKHTETAGSSLSPKGEARAIGFSVFYMKNADSLFHGKPDFFIATDPKGSKAIREVQTLLPLSNLLTMENPGADYTILHPFINKDWAKIRDYLGKAKFNKKIILVCWDHAFLPELAKSLGVKAELVSDWGHNDFSTIWVINYDNNGRVSEFKAINGDDFYKVYPYKTWEELNDKIKPD